MPQNCTALDFAFSIHTFLGSHCIGAKVNHKLVPLSHKLQSGDQVEILTSKSQKVQPSWIDFATTAKAKSKIQAILKRERKELQQKGEDMYKRLPEAGGNCCQNDANIQETLRPASCVKVRRIGAKRRTRYYQTGRSG